MTRTVNPLTGNPQIQTSGRLINVSSVVNENVNGTPYRIVTVADVITDKGKVTMSGIAWETNVQKGAHLGENVLVTIEKTNRPEPLVTVATNIVAGTRIDNSFFDWDHGTFVAPNARQVARAQERAAEQGIEPAWKGPGRDVRAIRQENPDSMAPVTGSEALHEK